MTNKENNFTIIRFIGTIFVFSGHMGMILGGNAPVYGGFALHEMGVAILFLIGGYLITKSWLSDRNILRYSIRRFFRLYPPYAVMILLMTFLAGPLLSDMGWKGYFSSWYNVYLWNLRFFIVYAQPGVFTDLPIPFVTNGSLWTMPVEAVMYIVTPVVCTLFTLKKGSRRSFRCMAVIIGILCVFDVYLRIAHAETQLVFYGTNLIAAFHLALFYLIGTLYTYDEMKKYLNLQMGIVLLGLMLIVPSGSRVLQFVLFYTAFPYAVFSMAMVEKPAFSWFGKKAELSYGIFLYGFLFQQIITSVQQKTGFALGYLGSLLISLLLTAVAAFISYYAVEKPMLRLGKFIQKKIP